MEQQRQSSRIQPGVQLPDAAVQPGRGVDGWHVRSATGAGRHHQVGAAVLRQTGSG